MAITKRSKIIIGISLSLIAGSILIGVILYFALYHPHHCCANSQWGPKYPPTKGEVWPKPQVIQKTEKYFILEPKVLKPNIVKYTCDILEKALNRSIDNFVINDLIRIRDDNRRKSVGRKNDTNYRGFIRTLDVELTSECEKYPSLNMDERYELNISATSYLKSNSIWGILRGLETFSQLFYFTDDFSEIRINKTSMVDFPAYTHRGLLVDTGRHYLSAAVILKMVDAMAMNKMNVLHWHLVDDQSFPYESEVYPALSERGAAYPTLVYHKSEIMGIIEYARLRGVRVIPELDVPGHARSWGNAYPNLLTQCYDGSKPAGLGPLNPINDEVFTFLKQLYQEIHALFPDRFLHIGGDETDFNCWKSNPDIKEYMRTNNMNAEQLQAQFITKTIVLLPNNTKTIVWQEVYDEGAELKEETLIQVWKYEWIQEMVKIIEAGHYVIFSSSWYLDYIDQGWEVFYKADPRQMVYESTQSEAGLGHIVGGEACMWGEMVDNVNVLSRTWPRASAVAERLWSGLEYRSAVLGGELERARRRIEEHACRMKRRAVPAQPPSGPGFCVGEPF